MNLLCRQTFESESQVDMDIEQDSRFSFSFFVFLKVPSVTLVSIPFPYLDSLLPAITAIWYPFVLIVSNTFILIFNKLFIVNSQYRNIKEKWYSSVKTLLHPAWCWRSAVCKKTFEWHLCLLGGFPAPSGMAQPSSLYHLSLWSW